MLQKLPCLLQFNSVQTIDRRLLDAVKSHSSISAIYLNSNNVPRLFPSEGLDLRSEDKAERPCKAFILPRAAEQYFFQEEGAISTFLEYGGALEALNINIYTSSPDPFPALRAGNFPILGLEKLTISVRDQRWHERDVSLERELWPILQAQENLWKVTITVEHQNVSELPFLSSEPLQSCFPAGIAGDRDFLGCNRIIFLWTLDEDKTYKSPNECRWSTNWHLSAISLECEYREVHIKQISDVCQCLPLLEEITISQSNGSLNSVTPNYVVRFLRSDSVQQKSQLPRIFRNVWLNPSQFVEALTFSRLKLMECFIPRTGASLTTLVMLFARILHGKQRPSYPHWRQFVYLLDKDGDGMI